MILVYLVVSIVYSRHTATQPTRRKMSPFTGLCHFTVVTSGVNATIIN